MKFKILAFSLALSLNAPSARAQDFDAWFGTDKGLHFSASYVLGSASYLTSTALFESRGLRVFAGALVGFGAGVAKEVYDYAGFGQPSWRDLAWDAMGTTVGVALSWLIDYAIDAAGGADGRHRARSAGSPTNR